LSVAAEEFFHLLQGESERGNERILTYAADANDVPRSEVFTWLGDLVGIFNDLPQRTKVEGMLKVLTTFGKEFAE
jgi:hypothetical protein